jgi:phospholipid/cholesterol/gamma-HCH transport system substrate-binding protein
MNEQAMKFRVGVFVLAAAMLLAVLVALFGGLPTWLRSHAAYTVLFRDAPGVTAGTPVRRSGVRIGEVRSVQLDDESGQVSVRVLIEKPHPLYKSDQAVLVHGLLGGDTSIDFVARRADGQPVELVPADPGAQFMGVNQAEVATLLNRTAQMVPDAQEALRDMRTTLQKFEKLIPVMEETLKEYQQLGKLARESVPDLRRTNDEVQNAARNWGRFGERADLLLQTNQDKLVKTVDNLNDTLNRVGTVFNDENQKNLAATLRNVKTGSERLEGISRGTEDLLRESQKTMTRVADSVTKGDEVLKNLQAATKPLAERSPAVMKNLEEGSERFNRVMADVSELVRAFGGADGSLRKLLSDPALYQNLSDAACMVVRLLPRLDRILRDVEVFADKIARHPEALGLRGVVNPGSGLKNAPSSHSTFRPDPPGH